MKFENHLNSNYRRDISGNSRAAKKIENYG